MMELKVWVEGIQRVVCGVTETTTCRDVVYALAHATGRTGRFTLVERWRTNERLLAPQERPVKVLTKWGEYSTDVQFTLLRSPLEKSPSGRRVARHRAGAAPRPVSPQPALGAEGASSTTVLSPELQRRPPAGSGGAELRLADSCAPTRGSVAVGVVRGVQQRHSPPSRQTPTSDKSPTAATQSHPAVPALNESVSSAASFSSSQEGGGPRTRFDTPPPYRDPPRPGRGGIRGHPPPYRQPPALTPPHADTSSHQQPSQKQRVRSPPLPASVMEPRTNGQWRAPVSSIGGVSSSPVISSPAAAVSDALLNNNEYRQLLAIVSSQKQRLSSLKSDIDKSDAEAVYVEQVQRENDAQMTALQMETDRLEAVLSERQSELASAEDDERALRREMRENERLQAEITAVREKMRQCEQRLKDYHNQLGDLSSAVPEERRLADGEEAAARDELLQLSRRVTQLQESQQLVAEQRAAVELELGRLTGQMDERQQRVRELHDELKQLNMQSLALSEASGGPAAVEGSARPGGGVSRQLKGSARQLETAVPTSTNPHGVWV